MRLIWISWASKTNRRMECKPTHLSLSQPDDTSGFSWFNLEAAVRCRGVCALACGKACNPRHSALTHWVYVKFTNILFVSNRYM